MNAGGGITASGSTAGPYVITYTVAASGGCALYTTTANVTITAAPSATISYSAPSYCSNDATVHAVTQTGTAGGSYSASPAGLVMNAGGGITASGSTVGPYVVTYTIAASGGCALYTTNANVTITAAPNATISYSAPSFCSSDATVYAVTQTGTIGGSYSSTAGLTINALTGDITPSTSTAGPYVVTYTIAASGGCALYSTTANVMITAAPGATISYSAPSYCSNDATVYSVTQTGTIGGSYSSTGGLTINSVTGDITPSTSTAGPYVITYTVGASGGCALYTTATNVSIDPLPVITVDPVDQTVCQNTTANFSVTATGSGLSYQWQKNGIDIGGETNSSFSIPSTATTDAANYDVVVTNGCLVSVTSGSASLTINTNPSFTLNPVDIVICAGTSGTLVSGATGTGLTFQWMKFTSPVVTTIVGATSSSYTINPASAGDAGTYYVVISGTCGSSVPSTGAVVGINSNVSVSVAPSDATVCSGTGASFSVSANGPVTGYQWQFGGVDIAGATSSSYSIASSSPSDAGSYAVVVSGSCGAPVTSTAANLTVNGGLPLVLSKTDECGVSSGTGIISFTAATGGWPYGFNMGATYTGSTPPVAATTNAGLNQIPVTGGQYTVRLYDPGSGCYGDQTITVNTNVKPTAFVFSGSGLNLCLGDTAQAVLKVQGSQVGIDYKFIHTSLLGVSDTSARIAGTGAVISFPSQSIAGSYVAYGYNISDTTCKTNMSGNHSIVLNPKPVIGGVTSGCVGGAGTGSLSISASITSGNSLDYSITGISYQPSGVFSTLGNGSYTVYVRDALTQCSDTVFNKVVYCNVAPVAVSDFNCSSTGNVLLNDADPDGNVLKATAQVNVLTSKGGHISLDTLGNYSYTAPVGFTGFDTASYTVCDKVLVPLCSNALLVIKTGIGGIHALKDTSSMKKDEVLSSSVSVLVNDYTDDGDSLYLQKVTNVTTSGGGKLSINSSGQYTYQPGGGYVGVDSYVYTIKDRCGNVSSASLEITVIETILKKIFIPEGFSPNGDGSHDLFELGNAEGYKIKIKVFNRWGSLVYEQNDYKAPGWWDGNSNTGLTLGDRLPDGTYFYEIETDAGDKYVRYLTLKR
jgi:gliding motility-associated-like protein